MKRFIAAALFSAMSLFAAQSQAALIQTDYNTLLPDLGAASISVDGDWDYEIDLAELASNEGQAYIDPESFSLWAYTGGFSISNGFISAGTLIDASMTFVTDLITPTMNEGLNYLGYYNTSACSTCYGWLEVNYTNGDMYLVRSVYDDTGTGIYAGGITPNDNNDNTVPAPAPLALLGLGLLTMGLARRIRQTQ